MIETRMSEFLERGASKKPKLWIVVLYIYIYISVY